MHCQPGKQQQHPIINGDIIGEKEKMGFERKKKSLSRKRQGIGRLIQAEPLHGQHPRLAYFNAPAHGTRSAVKKHLGNTSEPEGNE